MSRYLFDFSSAAYASPSGGLTLTDKVLVGDASQGDIVSEITVQDIIDLGPGDSTSVSVTPPANMDPAAITVQLAVDDLQSQIDGIGDVGSSNYIAGIDDPGAGDGVNGDFWLNTTTGDVFGPKAGGAWPGSPNGNAYSQLSLSDTAAVALTSSSGASPGAASQAARSDHVHSIQNLANTDLSLLGNRDVACAGQTLSFTNATGFYIDATNTFDVLAPFFVLTHPTAGTGASLRLVDGDAHTISIDAPSDVTASYRMLLPAAAGSADQVLGIVSTASQDLTMGWISGNNFAGSDLTFLGDRDHDLDGNNLTLSNGGVIQIDAGVVACTTPLLSVINGTKPLIRMQRGLQYLDISVPSLSSTYELQLPSSAPTENQILRVASVASGVVSTAWEDTCPAGWVTQTAADAVASGITYAEGKPIYIGSLASNQTLPAVSGMPDGATQIIYLRGGSFDWNLSNYQFGEYDDASSITPTQSSVDTKADRLSVIRRGSGSTINVDYILDADYSRGRAHLEPS